ncbi:flagellar export chaperone FliS [Pontibacillus salicampi]|uniref:Flagellar secretion chaperone FliS n=1 Tax=Pontibacillus salicampi TaxID=1449801 RepID=A0ABV6LSP0_9BACI
MGIEVYQNNSVHTASPGELTLMLYNGIIKFIKMAKKGLDDNNFEQKNINIQKTQNIITELMVTMDKNYKITEEIMPLYDYMNRRLMEANLKNDSAILDEILGMATEFRDTWKEVIRVNREQNYGNSKNV